MKICSLICSHSNPIYTKLTIESLLYHVGEKHDVSVHIGVHSNYSDYTSDFSLFSEYQDRCNFHLVDELDWSLHDNDIYRYSKMHSKNLINLFKQVKYFDFDYLIILDNDLHIKEDFFSKYVEDEDIIGSLYEDIDTIRTAINIHHTPIDFMPKLTIWNAIISRKAFNKIIIDPTIIYPSLENGIDFGIQTKNLICFDTFAKVLYYSKEWNLKTKLLPYDKLQQSIYHFFGSSFNYGGRLKSPFEHNEMETEALKLFNMYKNMNKI